MRSAITVLALAAAGFALTADDAEETTPPATEEATPEPPAEIPEKCAKLEDEEAKKQCVAEDSALRLFEHFAEEEAPPAKSGKGRSTSGNMEMEGEADE